MRKRAILWSSVSGARWQFGLPRHLGKLVRWASSTSPGLREVVVAWLQLAGAGRSSRNQELNAQLFLPEQLAMSGGQPEQELGMPSPLAFPTLLALTVSTQWVIGQTLLVFQSFKEGSTQQLR